VRNRKSGTVAVAALQLAGMQNKIAGLLMETGTPFQKEKLQSKRYFTDLLKNLEEVPESVTDLLRLSRGAYRYRADLCAMLSVISVVAKFKGEPIGPAGKHPRSRAAELNRRSFVTYV